MPTETLHPACEPPRGPSYIGMHVQPDGTLRGRPLAEEEHPRFVPGPVPPGTFTGYAFVNSGMVEPGTNNAMISGLAVALMTRTAVLSGHPDFVGGFTRSLGLWSGWNEAVSTALMGDWDAPLRQRGELGWEAWDELHREIRAAHARQQPLWRRRTGGLVRDGRRVEGRRTLLLETPVGRSRTLRDLLAEDTCPEDPLLDRIPGDPRLARILALLAPEERAVALALGVAGVVTWTEAAEYVGADDPSALGERVRRKVRRLVAEQARRDRLRPPAPASGLWRPGREGERA
ncbi:hypothetical protein ACGFYU_32695 [Streptomyces sp. NPDC048337]|uniref:hypothetical protein n=1 Tax=Streptomyces sp. NPDC048337 TaxID=3365535 RepID=UPI0037226E10